MIGSVPTSPEDWDLFVSRHPGLTSINIEEVYHDLNTYTRDFLLLQPLFHFNETLDLLEATFIKNNTGHFSMHFARCVADWLQNEPEIEDLAFKFVELGKAYPDLDELALFIRGCYSINLMSVSDLFLTLTI